MRGKFITLEGIDGAGKSTHVPFICAWITARGHEALATREPGGTPLGEKLRALLLEEAMQRDTEALLMFAARREQLLSRILPALERGAWVVCDRFTDSTFAYQCGGRGVDEARIDALARWVHDGIEPDLTLFFDAPAEVARARVAAATADPDRFERESAAFHARVRDAYLKRLAAFPSRIKRVDSTQPIAAIERQIASFLEPLVR
jgi:dTMP kinase